MSEAQNLFVELHALVSYAPSNLNRDDLGAPKTAVFGGVRRLRISSQCQKRSWRMAGIFRDQLETERDRVGERTARIGDVIAERLGQEKLSTDERRGLDAVLASLGTGKSSTGDDKEKKDDPGGEPADLGAEDVSSSTKTKHLLYLSQDEQSALTAFVVKERTKLGEIGNKLNTATASDAAAKAGAAKTAEGAGVAVAASEDKPTPKPKGKATGKKTEDANRKSAGEAIEKLRQRLQKHLVEYVPGSAADVALFGRFLTESEFREIDAAMQVAHALGTQKAEVEYDYFTAIDDRTREAGAGHIGETELAASVFYKYAACDTSLLCQNLGPSEDETKVAEKDADAKKKVDAHRASARAVAAKALKGIAFAIARVVPTGKKNSTAPQSPADYLEIVVRRDAPVSLVNAFLNPVRGERDHDVMDVSIRKLREHADTYDNMYGAEGIVARFVLSSREPWKGTKGPNNEHVAGSPQKIGSLDHLGEALEKLLLKELPA